MKEELRSARADEFGAIMRFLENAYGHTLNFWCHYFPAVSVKERFDFERTRLVVEGGRIRALVRVYPLELELGGVRVRAGGIGSVATDPETRGRGYMSRLMADAEALMKKEGFPISCLGGNRHRYLNFGYENGGRMVFYNISARGLARSGVRPAAARRFQGGADVLEAVAAVYGRNTYRCRRAASDYPLLFERSGLLLYHAGSGADFGYLALHGEKGRGGTAEFGGRPETVLGLALSCMERHGLAGLEFFFPGRAAVPPPYAAAASSWRVESAWMLKLIDPDAVLEAFAGQEGARPAPGREALARLSPPARVQALFGTLDPDAPFDFFLWPLDRI